jgi:Transposase IS4
MAEILAEIFNDTDSNASSDESDTESVDLHVHSDHADQSEGEDDIPDPPSTEARNMIFDWKTERIQPVVFPFTGASGINGDLLSLCEQQTELPTSLDFFSIFIHQDLIDLLVRETNRYADQHITNTNSSPGSRVHQWQPTNANEMKLFLAISMLMGVIRKPTIDLYWSTSTLFATPAFGTMMTRNRYCLILKVLHFCNNDFMLSKDSPDYDRLFKIRDVYNSMTNSFVDAYLPGKDIAIDEGMVRWFGRGFRTYLPSKRAKYGMKAYKLCEDSGYTYRFQLYTGQTAVINDNNAGHDTLQKSVLNLMSGLLDEGRTL